MLQEFRSELRRLVGELSQKEKECLALSASLKTNEAEVKTLRETLDAKPLGIGRQQYSKNSNLSSGGSVCDDSSSVFGSVSNANGGVGGGQVAEDALGHDVKWIRCLREKLKKSEESRKRLEDMCCKRDAENQVCSFLSH